MPNNNQEAMARLVVDTNSLIQCISRRSRYNDLWLSFLDGRNVMCVSTEIEADPDDDKFVDCAVACNAKFVVTDDNHFDVLKKMDFPKIDVIGLDEIIQQIK